MESNMVQREKLEANELLKAKLLEIVDTQRPRKIQDLVEAAQRMDSTLTIDEIKQTVDSIKDDGTIKLLEAPINASFIEFVKRHYPANLLSWLAIATSVIVLAITHVVAVEPIVGNSPESIMKITLGAAVVLLIPGYGLCRLILPKKEDGITSIGCLVISFAFSIAMVPLVFSIFAYSPEDLRVSLTISFMTVTGILLNMGSIYRQYLLRSGITSSVTTIPTLAPPANENERNN